MRFVEASILLLYLALAAAAVQLAVAKQHALGFHTRDYAYYARFHVALLDSDHAREYTLEPRGRNLLGYRGVEGARGFHRALHLEPVKYLRAVAALADGGLLSAHVFDALLFYAPALYLALRMPRRDGRDRAFYRLAAAVYLLLPAGAASVAYDLRPYALLLPLFALSVLAILARRSRAEVLLLFNALFLAREEALVLGAIALVAAWTDARARPWPGGRSPLGGLVASYAAWLAATLAYFAWTGYPRSASYWGVLSLLAGASLAAVVTVRRLARAAPGLLRWLPTLALAVALLPLLPRAEDARAAALLYDPRHALVAGCALLVGIGAWTSLRGRRARAFGVAAAAALLLGAAAAQGGDAPGSPRALRRQFAAGAREAALVFEARRGLDPLSSVLLCDYATHQAFYDFERAWAFNRLPWRLVPGPGRFYPENADLLQRLLRERVDTMVVAVENRDIVRRQAVAAGVAESLREVAANERFAVLRLERALP